MGFVGACVDARLNLGTSLRDQSQLSRPSRLVFRVEKEEYHYFTHLTDRHKNGKCVEQIEKVFLSAVARNKTDRYVSMITLFPHLN